ncbi:DUF6541 family protein [Pseudarthrobacter sp. NPDC058119]|uniref:DUF6541 family protein n=1 Tax=Pseudarthrobacter sp. NPDC058119 TaxID=3346348 RepID=UPI0036DB7D9A
MNWLGIIPASAVAVLLLYIPGAAIAWCLKFRLGGILGIAPLLSTAAAGLAGVVGGLLHVPWSVLPYLLVSAVLAAGAMVLTRGVPWRLTTPPWRQCLPFAALALATLPMAWRFIQLVGSPEHPSQVFDNVFHLNAIRFILDTGNASSLTLASIQGVQGLDAVYPAAWHSFAALLVQLASVDIPTAENILNLVIVVLLWPASCLFLVVKTISRRPAALIITAVIASTQVAFPFLMIVWGPLFPYAMALSMMPVVIVELAALVRMGRTRTEPRPSWAAALVLSLAGLAFAHTSSINITVALGLPILAILWWQVMPRRETWRANPAGAWLFLGGTVGILSVAAVLWLKLRPAPYDNWGPTVKPGAAVGEILTASTMQSAIPAVVVSVLSVYGLLTTFKVARWRWMAACYTVLGGLYIVGASFPKGSIRDILIGTWYQDTYRLAALLPLLVTPLAVIGGLRLWDLARGSRFGGHRWQVWEAAIDRTGISGKTVLSAAVVVVFALLASFAGPLSHYIKGASSVYRFDAQSELLTPDELALIQRLPTHVPSDAVIADNPWNGSSLAYAYTGRHVLTTHLFTTDDPDTALINQELGAAAENPSVCAALRNKNVQYVLDFGARYLIDLPGSEKYPALTNVSPVNGLTLVDSQGPDARLYRISSCG